MDIIEINKFIDEEIKQLRDYYKMKNDEELTLAMAIKIGEEVGELYNEILGHKGYQRKEKLDKLDLKDIEKEIADVLFTTLIVARRFNVDIESAIKEKMDKIRERNHK